MGAGEMDFTSYLHSINQFLPSQTLIQKPSLPFVVMIVSPHPDDECITSSLALRLMHENNAQVINVAVTLGSNKNRQKSRLKELSAACKFLEFELDLLSEDWKLKLKELRSLIAKYRPQLILAPHLKDHHPTHIRTGKLLQQALKTSKLKTLVAWTEFWAPIEKPNCLVDVPPEIILIQMQGLCFHEGEILRNPYHLRLPAWMMDNVRRGGEIINHPGSDVPTAAFGVLYKIEIFKNDRFTKVDLPTNFLSSFADIGQIFNEILLAASGSKTKVKRG
jgi:LmbE family N-acetylglucosaminyl deacetylase